MCLRILAARWAILYWEAVTGGDLSNKLVVLVVSAGRTGTQFFGRTLSSWIHDAHSVHEPDTLNPSLIDTWWKARTFGWRHMVVDRLRGRTGMRNLSQRFISGELSVESLADEILQHRAAYYGSFAERVIIESHYQWFGVLPGVPLAFPNHRVVGVVRDPRTWVTSTMNTERHYGSRDPVTRLGFRRLDPAMLGDSDFERQWPSMSPFERNCWHWKVIYETIAAHVDRDERARLFRYEDLFGDAQDTGALRMMMDFITHFGDQRVPYEIDERALQKRVNSSARRFPSWHEWTPDQARRCQRLCGPLMDRFGYGDEAEWRAKLA